MTSRILMCRVLIEQGNESFSLGQLQLPTAVVGISSHYLVAIVTSILELDEK